MGFSKLILLDIDGNNGIIYELEENHHGKAISINESGQDGMGRWCRKNGVNN